MILVAGGSPDVQRYPSAPFHGSPGSRSTSRDETTGAAFLISQVNPAASSGPIAAANSASCNFSAMFFSNWARLTLWPSRFMYSKNAATIRSGVTSGRVEALKTPESLETIGVLLDLHIY